MAVPLFLMLLFFIPSSIAKTSFRPRALALPVTKDQSTSQYVTTFRQRTPLVPLKLTVDLGGQFLWVDCDQGYVSSSYKPAHCNTAQCSLANSKACGTCNGDPRPGCNNNTCSLLPGNTITSVSTIGEVAQDVVSIQSTNGTSVGPVVNVPRLLFVCGSTFLLEGLVNGANGMAGLGRGRMGIPSQLASAFSFHRKFAVCLGPRNGVIFFGDRPYGLLPNVDVSGSLIYTPLLLNPVSTAGASFEGEPSAEYFIGVKSIQINGQPLPINTTLLSIGADGRGGTKISTVHSYTVMETSIFDAFTAAFSRALGGVPQVKPVTPFKLCYDATKIGGSRVGPDVPSIDLVLQNEKVVWKIFGMNSMVRISDTILCLGFVDGGVEPTTTIVIGAHQIEDNLLQFDLAASRLGFTSSLWLQKTTCSNFRFP